MNLLCSGKCIVQCAIRWADMLIETKVQSNHFSSVGGSGMIYSGSGSGPSFEFSEFRIRIQAKVPDPGGFGSGSSLY